MNIENQLTRLNIRNSTVQTGICLAAFWTFILLFSRNQLSPTGSFITTLICGTLSVALALAFCVRSGTISKQASVVAFVLFYFRVSLGVLHYLYVFDDQYFNVSYPIFEYISDYESLSFEANRISHYWSVYGFGQLPYDINEYKNYLLYPYFALLFYVQNNEHFLNYSILNSLHAILVAIILADFAENGSRSTKKDALFLILCLSPFGIISSIQWRDSVGQYFLTAGLVLCATRSIKIRSIGTIIIGATMMMLLRNIYFLVGIATPFASLLRRDSHGRAQAFVGFLIALGMALLIIASYNRVNYYDLESSRFIYNQGVGVFILGVIKGLLGAFPWTQIFDQEVIGREFIVQDILQSCFSLCCILYFFRYTHNRGGQKFSKYETNILAGAITIISAGLFTYGHSAYIAVLSPVLIICTRNFDARRFIKYFFTIIFAHFVAGLLWDLLKSIFIPES